MSPAAVMGEAIRSLAGQAGAFEVLLLLATALHKAVRWPHLLRVLRGFAGIPAAPAPAVLAAVVALEASAGGLLLMPRLRTVGALLAVWLWTAYLALIVRAIFRDRRDTDCGCSFGLPQRPLGAYHVARNVVLLAVAVCVLRLDPPRAASAPQAVQWLAAGALLALYGALDQVMGLKPLRGGELA